MPKNIGKDTQEDSEHNGLQKLRGAEKPFLTIDHVSKRLEWAQDKLHWIMEEWSRVIWTDEASVELGRESKRVDVWRKKVKNGTHSA